MVSKARVWLRWTNLILIVITLVAYTGPLISPAKGWLPALLAVIFPWLLLGNILFIIAWAALRSRNAFFSLACLLLGWGHVRSFIGFHGSARPLSDDTTVLKVATLNAHNLVDWETGSNWVSPENLLQVVEDSGADIFCFQEFGSEKSHEYKEYLTQKSSLRYDFTDNHSLLILSRYPIEQGREVLFANRSNGFQEADIQIGEHKVRLFNLHLQSNSISGELKDWMEEKEPAERSQYPGRVSFLFKRYWHGAKVRAEQAEQVAGAIHRSRYPVIVCGDFNDVPLSWAYRKISEGLTDGFKARGAGLATTYSGNLPALRIDYILNDPGFKVLRYRSRKVSFSDHKTVSSHLALPSD